MSTGKCRKYNGLANKIYVLKHMDNFFTIKESRKELEMTIDYGKTIHLPKSDFPRRAGLATKEPIMQERWESMDLYNKQRKASEGKEKFILHMGPPFANGHFHMGHLLSTGLKDVVCRSYQMMGYDAPLIPGFDCHGLPIEWKVEENFVSQGKQDEKDRDPVGFRKACREFAAKWIKVQSDESKRMGIFGKFDDPYVTMHKKSEALIAREIHKFLLNGSIYLGSKPVMWSVPEKTALAEAEVEYKDVTSDTLHVAFPIKETKVAELQDAHIVIWTTTPWTLPANRAVAYGEKFEYVAIQVKDKPIVAEEGEPQKPNLEGKKLVVAKALLEDVLKAADILEYDVIWEGTGADVAGTICKHPLADADKYFAAFDVPALAGDFVTTEAGTGFVHIAPSHGEDDYKLGIENGIDVPFTVNDDGTYAKDMGLFAGLEIYTYKGKKGPANKVVTAAIMEQGYVVAKGQIQHSYPHSWRSKAPVLFRNTPQWFISMEKNDLRNKAIAEIAKTRFVPDKGRNRIGAMVEGRGDWCISRQRAWGVPLSFFINKDTREPLMDQDVLDKTFEIFCEEGSDAWFNHPVEDFLCGKYSADEYEQVKDIIDVWFESGSTQSFVLEEREDQQYPADLYLEGSDQHRGWFQSSLLVGCGTRGQAPFKSILGHGFILDEKGYKMSKSIGNVMSPIKLAEQYGADVLRIWVAGSDYTTDTKVGHNILKGCVDVYKRIRGTFCYLLGNLNGFIESDKLDYDHLSDMDKWVLHRVYEVDKEVRQAILDYDFSSVVNTVHNFCSRELSSFYFDICKDTLYCEAKDSVKRKSIQTVLDTVFNHLVHWLAATIPFTTEEAWLSYNGLTFDDMEESLHLRSMPEVDAKWHNTELDAKWNKIQQVRSVVTGALEIKRGEKMLGSALESAPKVYISDAELLELVNSTDFADICITSDIEVIEGEAPEFAFKDADVAGVAVVVEMAEGEKCERCWKYDTGVGSNDTHPTLCPRCAAVVEQEGVPEAA